MDENNAWVTSMSALGYVRGPKFSSYEELSAWDALNTRAHVRRLISGEYMVYFTDAKLSSAQMPQNPENGGSPHDLNDVPF